MTSTPDVCISEAALIYLKLSFQSEEKQLAQGVSPTELGIYISLSIKLWQLKYWGTRRQTGKHCICFWDRNIAKKTSNQPQTKITQTVQSIRNSRKYQGKLSICQMAKIVIHCEEEKVNLCIYHEDKWCWEFHRQKRYPLWNQSEKWMKRKHWWVHTLLSGLWTSAVAFHGHYKHTSDFQMCASSYPSPFKLSEGMAWLGAVQSFKVLSEIQLWFHHIFSYTEWSLGGKLVGYSFHEAKERAESWFSLPKVLFCTVSRNKTLFMSLAMAYFTLNSWRKPTSRVMKGK